VTRSSERNIGDYGFKVSIEIDAEASTIRITGTSPEDDPMTLTGSGLSSDGMRMFAECAEKFMADGIAAQYDAMQE
jgi:hypothetical protein